MNRPITKKVYKRRIVRYKKRVPLYKSVGNSLNIRCEYYDNIKAEAGAIGYGFGSNPGLGIRYKSIKEIILNSHTYLKFAPLYGKVRINSIKIMVAPVNNLLSVSTNVFSLPLAAFAFYPNFIATNVDSSATPAHDTSLIFNPAVNSFQTKTWKFPKQFYEGDNGTGYGVSFDPGNLNSLSGQISLTNIQSFQGNPGLSYIVFNLICQVGITLSDQIW